MTDDTHEPRSIWQYLRRHWGLLLIISILATAAFSAIRVYSDYLREQRIAKILNQPYNVTLWKYSGPSWVPDSFRSRLWMFDRIDTASLNGHHTNADVERLVDLKELTYLYCGARVTDAGLKPLSRLARLRHLSLPQIPLSQPDTALEPLRGLTKVINLDLLGTNISDRGLEPLSGLIELQQLNLTDTGITGSGLIHIQHLPKLISLSLDGTKVGDEHLQNLPSLEGLYLREAPITDAGIRSIVKNKGLRFLGLRQTAITDESLIALQQLTNLESLDISRTKITDRGLKALENLKGLTLLKIDETATTDEGQRSFQKAVPNCILLIVEPST